MMALRLSLVGRIALHILKKHAARFEKFIFLSTHAGLLSDTEKLNRKKNDSNWSDRLNHSKWADFLEAWNRQPVFSGAAEPLRLEDQFDKNKLSEALLKLSLAEQENMNDVILMNKNKVIWAVGSLDQKFLDMAEDLVQKKILEDYSRIFCGHRILFEKPEEILNLLK
jgi:2-succinyl-6-hydroxy-2,4-cyclohexadiene-1-carboxylate synthase